MPSEEKGMKRNNFGRIASAVAVLVAVVFIPFAAFASGGGVRFSYEKVELGGASEWVLMPRAESSLGGKVTSATLKKAFQALRKDKGTTYGKSTISVSGTPPRAKVTVKIDKAVANYALIIIAETVYTMSELGVDKVFFPGHVSGAIGREDVPFAAYALTVPLWKSVGRFDSEFVHVRMPDGSLESSETIAKRWKANDSNLRKDVYSYLKSGDTYTVTAVAKRLPELKVPYTDEIVPLLDSKNGTVQRTALTVLASDRNNKKVLDAVEKLVDDKDESLARLAAEFLGKAKSSNYQVVEQYFLLRRGKSSEKMVVAKKLAKNKDKRTVTELANALEDKDGRVAAIAADGLAALDADDAQKKALGNSKVLDSVKLDIARDLARDKSDSSAIAGLTYVAQHAPDYEAVAAISALGELKGNDARDAIEGFIGADQEYLRLAAAETLVGVGSPASLDAIARGIKAGKNARELEEAGYRLMVAQPLKVVLDHTKDRNKLVQRIAYRAAGARAQKENGGARAFNVLEQGTTNRDPLIRGAAARAIGTFANKQAEAVLKKLADDKSGAVRADVAYAIGYLPEGTMAEQLKEYLDDKEPEVQAAAMTSLARRGEAFAWDRIKQLSASKNPRVRASALAAMAKLVSRDDKQGVREVISELSGGVSDQSILVRETALESLGTFSDDQAVTAIALQTGAEETKMRIAAVRALGATGNKSATDLIENMLMDENRNVREAAIVALGELKDPAAKSALQKRAKAEKDAQLVGLIQQTLKKL